MKNLTKTFLSMMLIMFSISSFATKMNELPQEIGGHVFSFLSCKDAASLRATSKACSSMGDYHDLNMLKIVNKKLKELLTASKKLDKAEKNVRKTAKKVFPEFNTSEAIAKLKEERPEIKQLQDLYEKQEVENEISEELAYLLDRSSNNTIVGVMVKYPDETFEIASTLHLFNMENINSLSDANSQTRIRLQSLIKNVESREFEKKALVISNIKSALEDID